MYQGLSLKLSPLFVTPALTVFPTIFMFLKTLSASYHGLSPVQSPIFIDTPTNTVAMIKPINRNFTSLSVIVTIVYF